MVKVVRKCYNKPFRCPGRAGSGRKYASTITCEGGVLEFSGEWTDSWKFHTCPECGIVTWPEVVQWLDPLWVWETIEMKWRFR